MINNWLSKYSFTVAKFVLEKSIKQIGTLGLSSLSKPVDLVWVIIAKSFVVCVQRQLLRSIGIFHVSLHECEFVISIMFDCLYQLDKCQLA